MKSKLESRKSGSRARRDPEAKPASPIERVARPPRLGTRHLLGVRVDAGDAVQSADRILAMAEAQGGMTCSATRRTLLASEGDESLARALRRAEWVTPGDEGVAWALRALGVFWATCVRGVDLLSPACEGAARAGLPIGFYGGAASAHREWASRLAESIPGLQIAFTVSPPESDAPIVVDERVVSAIEDSGTRVLFVGLESPAQESWMDAHRDALPCALVGVGDAFEADDRSSRTDAALALRFAVRMLGQIVRARWRRGASGLRDPLA